MHCVPTNYLFIANKTENVLVSEPYSRIKFLYEELRKLEVNTDVILKLNPTEKQLEGLYNRIIWSLKEKDEKHK